MEGPSERPPSYIPPPSMLEEAVEGGAQAPKSNFLDCRLTPSPVSPDAAVAAATASAFAEEALSFCPRCLCLPTTRTSILHGAAAAATPVPNLTQDQHKRGGSEGRREGKGAADAGA